MDLDKALREAKLAARLKHANAVAVSDALLDTSAVFIVMELVQAPTLHGVVGCHRLQCDVLAVTAEGPDAYKEPTLVLIPWALPGLVSVIAPRPGGSP